MADGRALADGQALPDKQTAAAEARPTKGMTLVVAAKLHANQLERHLELLEYLPSVARVIVVRHEALPPRLNKLENATFSSGSLPTSVVRMFRRVDQLLATERVDWVVGFNPVPWGSVAQLAAARRKVKCCLSLIGRDYLQLAEPWALPFRRSLARSERITVTGTKMKHGLIERGLSSERIHVLPHSVDLTRFRPRNVPTRYDVLSVGQLIVRKRMDLLIEAVGILKERGLLLQLGILGRGPEEARLRQQIERLGLTRQVELLAYRDDVETLLAQARSFALVSEWEGVPFALMEAMATGLVPLVTDVGTISDWVSHETNGLLVPRGDAQAVADSLQSLAGPSPLWERMQAQILAERERLSFETGVQAWRDILSTSSA